MSTVGWVAVFCNPTIGRFTLYACLVTNNRQPVYVQIIMYQLQLRQVDDSPLRVQNFAMQYRRNYCKGATYFFTVVTFARQPLFNCPETVAHLREAFQREKLRRPFTIDAIVIIPDHIHAVLTMPVEDANYSIRWRNIKSAVTAKIAEQNRPIVHASRERKHEQAIWQRRFWEHRIRDERDFDQHVNYIHYNPVKHGYVQRPVDWPHSSIHRYIRQGVLTAEWGASPIPMIDQIGHE
jgi:putative transposase